MCIDLVSRTELLDFDYWTGGRSKVMNGGLYGAVLDRIVSIWWYNNKSCRIHGHGYVVEQ